MIIVVILLVLFILVSALVYFQREVEESAHRFDFSKYCIFDFETTGLSVDSGDRIVEYAFLNYKSSDDNKHSMDIISSFVNPEGKIVSKDAYRVNGIKDEWLKESPLFRDRLESIINFIGNRKLIAHNVNFDREFFEDELSKAGYRNEFVYVDSIDLIKAAFPELPSYKLDFLCEGFKTKKPTHRAENDVTALFKLLYAMSGRIKDSE